MLLKVNDLIGSKIVSYLDDTVIDSVKDVVYDPTENKITAVVVREKKLLQDAYVLPFGSIGSITDNRVYIHAGADIKKVDHAPESVSHITKDNFYLTNSKIVTDSGQSLGYITDMLFHPDTGIVEEFEVTDRTRILNKVASRRNISVKDIITVGRRSTIVQDTAITTDSNPELNSVSHQRDTGTVTSDNQLSKLDEWFQRTPMFTKRELKEFKKYMYTAKREEVIGMYLTKNILLENDNFFAQSGELVTHKMVDDAEQLGLLEQIIKHASPLPPAISYQIRYLITQSL